MSIDTSIPCRTRQIFVLSVRYVLVSSAVSELLGQTKINDIDEVSFLTKTHEEIVGLDICQSNNKSEMNPLNILLPRWMKFLVWMNSIRLIWIERKM